MKSDRTFFPLIALWFLIISVLGFSRNFTASAEDYTMPTYVKLHATAFILWVLLFFFQTILIRVKKVKLHILLGQMSFIIAISMIITGFYVAYQAVPDNGGRMFGQQIKIISLFACFFILGMVNRKIPDQHKRYMVFATINIMSPAVFRIELFNINQHPALIFAVIFIPTIALVVYDLVTTKKLNKATIVGVSLILGVGLLTGLFYKTDIWKGIIENI